MSDLETQQESPQQEEYGECINVEIQAYDYAIYLYTYQGKSWEEVKQELMAQGVDTEYASVVVFYLKEHEHEQKKEAAKKDVLYGMLWVFAGVKSTHLLTSTGGTLVCYGMALWGGWRILKGLWHKWMLRRASSGLPQEDSLS